jgi:hypothetical protein
MDSVRFTEAYRKVCNSYNREGKQDQANFFYEQLQSFSDADIPIAIESIIQLGKMPTLKEWQWAFYDARRKNRRAITSQYTGTCPKCGSGTVDRKLPTDDEWYELCTACVWKQRLYTLDEWKIRNGYEGKTMLEISQILRDEMKERGISRWSAEDCR